MQPNEAGHPFLKLLHRLRRPFANIVQVGANSGQEVSAFQFHGLDWAVMIEPLDQPFRELSEKVADLPHFIAVQALCSSLEGTEYEFHVSTNDGQSSSFLQPTRHRSVYPHVEFPTSVKLTSSTVDRVMEGVLRAHPGLSLEQFDCLMLDVQGAELKVLMGATKHLQHCRYVFAEVSYDLYENGATVEELQAFLSGFGFRLKRLELNRHGWGDALFIKVA